ncbi:MAG: hypothetical protein ACOX5F_06420 [Anaerovoracaceae bacterium]|jgi:hypothetical protein
MSNNNKAKRYLNKDIIHMMENGYQEMGKLNVSLSEEGLSLDKENLESYEKYLVESE